MHAPVLRGGSSKRQRAGQPKIFNIDLHMSVIRDLEVELQKQDASLVRWSISGNNFVQRRLFQFPDPVGVVNQETWHELDENMIDRFQSRYGRYLNSFDGFVVTHTPSFSELFRGLDRPILTIASTRYEAPYTTSPEQWSRFNAFLRREVDSRRLILAANNRGDVDYCEFFLGRKPQYVPSVCDYTGAKWSGKRGLKVYNCRSADLRRRIEDASSGHWIEHNAAFPRGYSWPVMASVEELFTVPYNVSTMTLFELATMGVPVSIPSRQWMSELWDHDNTVLSEVTWFQVLGKDCPQGANPNNIRGEHFLQWWMDRSDFYDSELMPNVRLVDSFDQLVNEAHPATAVDRHEYMETINNRNRELRARRSSLISEFLALAH
jgi:hypothetical protein